VLLDAGVEETKVALFRQLVVVQTVPCPKREKVAEEIVSPSGRVDVSKRKKRRRIASMLFVVLARVRSSPVAEVTGALVAAERAVAQEASPSHCTAPSTGLLAPAAGKNVEVVLPILPATILASEWIFFITERLCSSTCKSAS
jgi:hypothetical protein